jgi:hypothetical protein
MVKTNVREARDRASGEIVELAVLRSAGGVGAA